MNGPPSEGIYFVVLTPGGWKLAAKRLERGEDLYHVAWWEESLALVVAEAWSEKLGCSAKKLAGKIDLLAYGFPRGRVSKVDSRFLVLHGADLQRSMGVSKADIEAAFGISRKCEWLFDEHEQCQIADQAELCRCLGVTPSWSAI